MKRTRTELSAVCSNLLSDLLAALVDKPECVSIAASELDYSTVFSIKAHPDDAGKIVGRLGLHIKSVQHLFSKIGRQSDHSIFVNFKDGVRAPNRERPRSDPRSNPSYKAAPAEKLLKRIVSELVITEFRVTTQKMADDVYFTIALMSREDYELFSEFDMRGDLNTRIALESLWKAYGHKEGVVFHLDVVPVKPEAARAHEKTR